MNCGKRELSQEGCARRRRMLQNEEVCLGVKDVTRRLMVVCSVKHLPKRKSALVA